MITITFLNIELVDKPALRADIIDVDISFTTSANYVNGMIVGNALGDAANLLPNSVLQGLPQSGEPAPEVDPSSFASTPEQVVARLFPSSGTGSSVDLNTLHSGFYSEQLIVGNVLGGHSSSLLANTYGSFNAAAQVVSFLA